MARAKARITGFLTGTSLKIFMGVLAATFVRRGLFTLKQQAGFEWLRGAVIQGQGGLQKVDAVNLAIPIVALLFWKRMKSFWYGWIMGWVAGEFRDFLAGRYGVEVFGGD